MQANGSAPDVLTFAGNGEPTAHPYFPEIIEDTLALRDKYFPKAKVSVLSNSTFIDRPAVFEALKNTFICWTVLTENILLRRSSKE